MEVIPTLAHKHYVQRLYKRSLKCAADWYWQRGELREKCVIIRSIFDANKNVSSPQEVIRLLAYTEKCLAVYQHPQPYIRKIIVKVHKSQS